MAPIPREDTLDSTLSLLSEGYAFISNRCRHFDSDVFETRIMLTPALLRALVGIRSDMGRDLGYHTHRCAGE